MIGLGLAVLAISSAPVERDAPWALTGVSQDGRTLHLVYEGGGCKHDDGRATVTETQSAITIRVRQTVEEGPDVVCTLELRELPLDVPLGAPVNGRPVEGGPAMSAARFVETMPRVLGLERDDAVGVLSRIGQEVHATGHGAVTSQTPKPGAPLTGEAELVAGGLTIRIVRLRPRSLRFRYAVDGATTMTARVTCDGAAVGGWTRPVNQPRGRATVPIDDRLADGARCRLAVEAGTLRRTARATLRGR